MDKVYVKWYGTVMEGELLPDWFLGMRQVRISLNDHHVVALFKEFHIYDSAEEAEKSLALSHEKPAFTEKSLPLSEISEEDLEISQPQPSDEIIERREETSRLALKFFKEEHWDHKHNHLRTDSLETFYMFWRNAHGGHRADSIRYTVAVDPAKPGDDHTVIATVPVASPTVKPQPKKLTKKQLRSAEAIHFTDSVQTSIFDLL